VNLQPITLFCLSAAIGSLGGLWSVLSRDEPQEAWRERFVGMLGGGLIGLVTSLGLYERIGTTEFGACTLLALSLVFSMAGKAGFQRLFDGLARLYLGPADNRSHGGPWEKIDQRRRPDPPRFPQQTQETQQQECEDDQQDSGPEMSTWP
jgi:hypothetical protein